VLQPGEHRLPVYVARTSLAHAPTGTRLAHLLTSTLSRLSQQFILKGFWARFFHRLAGLPSRGSGTGCRAGWCQSSLHALKGGTAAGKAMALSAAPRCTARAYGGATDAMWDTATFCADQTRGLWRTLLPRPLGFPHRAWSAPSRQACALDPAAQTHTLYTSPRASSALP